MTPEDFVNWLRGFVDGIEVASHDSWSALDGIKKKLKEVGSAPAIPAPVITSPVAPWPQPVQPVWVGGEPGWPKVGDIICHSPIGEAHGGMVAQ